MADNHLSQLTWLSVDQALRYLKEKYSVQLSELDLLSHCEDGNCVAQLPTRGVAGKSATWIQGEGDTFFQEVYGAARSHVLNPLDILNSVSKSAITVNLSGQVYEHDDVESSPYQCEEWSAEMLPENCRFIFAITDIESFAKQISGGRVTAPAEEKPSLVLAIAALVELLTENPPRRFTTQDAIASEIESRHSSRRGMSASNLTKIFADCNKAAKDADKR
ncbi:hypothetical protein D3879_15685 [Pseudomonas cavernicola]|uniref:Uncharacterized protein n=1 Tax=Pseudomonas cavernicola TaxID=2320866 RepID=A0A418XF97_9PSED|nr:hypothetical protein [Pseudomonas cavernicola]RJG11100.1 hypothetical protein D3879_15685 [Pseudomonas cavernicola]